MPACCNCRGCPVKGACMCKSVVYHATVVRVDNWKVETYIGLTASPFKEGFYEHRQDFNNNKRAWTSLSNYVWRLKSDKVKHNITWKIIAKSQSFNPATKRCNLCIKEKYCIMFREEGATLNDRSELFSTCRHRLKPLLANT